MVAPLTGDQIGYTAQYYGVKISSLGEDGDEGWVAFTHDQRRAVAALHRHIRIDCDAYPVRSITAGSESQWWVVVDNCGCGPVCPHEEDEEGDRDHDDCDNYGLPPCHEQVMSWVGESCAEGTPGAVPVIKMAARY